MHLQALWHAMCLSTMPHGGCFSRLVHGQVSSTRFTPHPGTTHASSCATTCGKDAGDGCCGLLLRQLLCNHSASNLRGNSGCCSAQSFKQTLYSTACFAIQRTGHCCIAGARRHAAASQALMLMCTATALVLVQTAQEPSPTCLSSAHVLLWLFVHYKVWRRVGSCWKQHAGGYVVSCGGQPGSEWQRRWWWWDLCIRRWQGERCIHVVTVTFGMCCMVQGSAHATPALIETILQCCSLSDSQPGQHRACAALRHVVLQ
jgi:hypothetical protein